MDIIASSQNSLTISGLQANEYDISHHFLVDFCIAISPELKVNHVAFATDISNQLYLSDSVSFGENVKAYHDVLASVLNEHAPMKSCIIKIVHNAPWFDHEKKSTYYGNKLANSDNKVLYPVIN